jgi:hypothetical protein
VVEFVFRSSLPTVYRDALEQLVFFNPRQRIAEAGITQAVDLYGTPTVEDDGKGLRVVVGKRADAQCLFALAQGEGEPKLAGMVMYLRVSRQEVVVLHIGVSEAFCRSRRAGLEVVSALVRTVRTAARRLRGVERLTMVYLRGRQFRIAIGERTAAPELLLV